MATSADGTAEVPLHNLDAVGTLKVNRLEETPLVPEKNEERRKLTLGTKPFGLRIEDSA